VSAKRIPKSCQQRHHSYDSDGLDAVCLGCGKKRGTREPRALGAGGAQSLRTALGLPGSPAPGPEQQPRQPEPGPETVASPPGPAAAPAAAEIEQLEPRRPKPSTVIWPKVAHRLTQAFDTLTDAMVEKTGRVPNAAEPEDLQDFEGALAEQLGIWFPDVAAGPKARMGLAAFFIVMEKRWNAEKMAAVPPVAAKAPTATPPPAEDPRPADSAAPDAATANERALLHLL
jgi:hypothetical protein